MKFAVTHKYGNSKLRNIVEADSVAHAIDKVILSPNNADANMQPVFGRDDIMLVELYVQLP